MPIKIIITVHSRPTANTTTNTISQTPQSPKRRNTVCRSLSTLFRAHAKAPSGQDNTSTLTASPPHLRHRTSATNSKRPKLPSTRRTSGRRTVQAPGAFPLDPPPAYTILVTDDRLTVAHPLPTAHADNDHYFLPSYAGHRIPRRTTSIQPRPAPCLDRSEADRTLMRSLYNEQARELEASRLPRNRDMRRNEAVFLARQMYRDDEERLRREGQGVRRLGRGRSWRV
ncbi:hypothetical protein CC80DRAFT_584057 [Byssothecium circinans]|uniref:Uncharacterized protein n=1 Tax=Byssothecium circinans TaxID=147558 RepID=A0A6A5U336_9PLEO|nr:hypothetical protein CC80DRAFT_584057 [Byssothecium circinans]